MKINFDFKFLYDIPVTDSNTGGKIKHFKVRYQNQKCLCHQSAI
jgi:hypothetical protein